MRNVVNSLVEKLAWSNPLPCAMLGDWLSPAVCLREEREGQWQLENLLGKLHLELKMRKGNFPETKLTPYLTAEEDFCCLEEEQLVALSDLSREQVEGPCVNRPLESTGVVARLLTQGAHSAPPLSSAPAGPVRCPSSTESMPVS
ncbi:hypothetical protein NQZ68_035243 [Dissostichus eleginoides]|nr:hypothetical protein NQZ68_035243 [Dissostichus eleginoides]